MTQHTRKRFEALPSAGIYIRYKRRSSRRRQSAREQIQIFERIFKSVNTFSLCGEIVKFSANLERMARQVLRRFEQNHGMGKLHPLWEKALKSHALVRRQAQINRRIEEIRDEAAAPNALEVLKMRKRLAEAEGAADALELLNHARIIPVYIRDANLAEQSGLAVWRGIATAFEMGQACERIRIRPLEAHARTAIVRVKKARESNRQRVADKSKERVRAYEEERSRKPDASHWAVCRHLAPRFMGNRGHPLTPRAFSNSIPRSKRIVSTRRP
jgi:hypothetical protein